MARLFLATFYSTFISARARCSGGTGMSRRALFATRVRAALAPFDADRCAAEHTRAAPSTPCVRERERKRRHVGRARAGLQLTAAAAPAAARSRLSKLFYQGT